MLSIMFFNLWRQFGVWITTGALAAAVGASTGFAYSLLSEPTGLESLGGPDNYYVPVEQLQAAMQQAQADLLHYSAGLSDAVTVRKSFNALQTQFNAVQATAHAERGVLLRATPGYAEALHDIGQIIKEVRPVVSELPSAPTTVDAASAVRPVVQELDSLSTPMETVRQAAGSAEELRREAMARSVTNKRHYLVIALVVLATLLIGTMFSLAAVLRRKQLLVAQHQSLLQQQAAAIEAERSASIEAQNAAHAKNAFLGMLGHELRTPLQSILSVTDALATRHFPDTDAIMVRRLALAAERLDSQMKDLTDYARLDAGRLTLRPELFDAVELAQSLVEDVRDEAGRKGLGVVLETSGERWPCRSDPARISQILGNLLSNAIRYTDHGTVRVGLVLGQMVEGERLTLTVQDTGPGIPHDAIDELFKPFVRLDESHTRVHEGAGIGLAIVRGLADLLGGWVNIDSDTGLGTTVTVSLPVEIVRQSLPSPMPKIAAPLEGRLVLIVDDTESARESLADTVVAMSAHVDVVASGVEAFEAVAESIYDVILLDIQMPEIDGIEVARRIRRSVSMNRTAIIVGVSAYSTELLARDDAALFDVQLQKPVRAMQLEQALRSVMKQELA
ncbi:hybrid sensor histidine kinase/response regulator [Paraburkholderia flagellata]|uniref:hybrid sensor histidine kinase/response regulator n=1 Tax=Paraburkholderia flagellata TaxID=2883241 RepID=UPI001F255B05|nr:hybrid sensor histidine kinase/response regulator [Paraburkholderia flagellata]